jgi:transporter family-2 protein
LAPLGFITQDNHMTPYWILAGLALLAGLCIPTQAGINVLLSDWTRSPVLAATISFAVGTLALLGFSLSTGEQLPSLATAAKQPLWIWSGGLLGAFFVAVTIFLAPRLGATVMLAWLLAGQMVASLILDHYGWLGFPIQPFSTMRLCGVALLCAGVILIRQS